MRRRNRRVEVIHRVGDRWRRLHVAEQVGCGGFQRWPERDGTASQIPGAVANFGDANVRAALGRQPLARQASGEEAELARQTGVALRQQDGAAYIAQLKAREPLSKRIG